MEMLLVFVFGLAIGSFFNLVNCRLAPNLEATLPSEGPSRGSLVLDRSRCPKCGHALSWYELVPLVSFAIQRARCRACGEKISWQYPLVELATALLITFIYNFLPA